jgi:hypothetical protein
MEIPMPNLLTPALVKTMLRIFAALLADAAGTIGHGLDRLRGGWSSWRESGPAPLRSPRSRAFRDARFLSPPP